MDIAIRMLMNSILTKTNDVGTIVIPVLQKKLKNKNS